MRPGRRRYAAATRAQLGALRAHPKSALRARAPKISARYARSLELSRGSENCLRLFFGVLLAHLAIRHQGLRQAVHTVHGRAELLLLLRREVRQQLAALAVAARVDLAASAVVKALAVAPEVGAITARSAPLDEVLLRAAWLVA